MSAAHDVVNCLGLVNHARTALVEALTQLGSGASPHVAVCEALADVSALEDELRAMRAESEPSTEAPQGDLPS
ncbi:MAG: hypothetical protein IPM35_18315 [Myxococcales bacterium]|nr:hypothetical protein [Myxococcales bacterium]